MKPLALTIIVFILSRISVNFTRRFAYPFIPTLADQLNTTIPTLQTVLAISWGVGIASPLFGTLSERYGRKRVMLGSLLFMILVSMLGATWATLPVFAVVVIGYGIGKMIFDPALQAYIGERIPFHKRAQAWGAIELSWAGSLFVAAPLTGFLLAEAGLNLVFVTLVILMGMSFLLIWRLIPRTNPTRTGPSLEARFAWLAQIRSHPRALAALGYTVCVIAGQEIFLINYGIWMAQSFDLVLTALGIATVVIGLAEVVGELIVSLLGDRLGKRNLALYGALLGGVAYLVVPQLSQSLPLALAGMFVLFVLIELAIVASITLFTEVLPEARAVMMSANLSASSVGRLLGALVGGGLLALSNSFTLIGAVTMVIVLTGCVLMWQVRGLED